MEFFVLASNKIKSLEACRFFAAMLVVLHHAGTISAEPRFLGHEPLGGFFHPGHLGVEFFFVLSGFIIMHVHEADRGRPERLGAYLWRRFSRVYLPYWAVLALLVPAYFFTAMGSPDKRDPLHIVLSALLVAEPGQPVLGVAWSLTHEVFFYALFAAFIVSRRLMWPVLGIWLVLIACNQYLWQKSFPASFIFSLYNVLFVVGVCCAVWLRRHRLPAPGTVLCLGVALIAGTWGLELADLIGWDGQRYAYGAGSALSLMALVELERSERLQVPAWLEKAGAASYALYLVHTVAQSFILNASFRTGIASHIPEAVLFGALVILSVLAGIAFHLIVERPMVRLTRGHRTRPAGRLLGAPAAAR
jgi:exopolysaccharide production protein ExoZ